MILALLATLGAIVVAFVLYPVFTEAPAGGAFDAGELDDDEEDDPALAELRDKKARLYESIRELDFDKAAGKISAADYEAARNDYLAQVSAVMAEIDARAPTEPAPAHGKHEKKQRKRKPASDAEPTLACSSCGEENPAGSKFCLECGTSLGKTCGSCGESLPPKARFCIACGEKVSP